MKKINFTTFSMISSFLAVTLATFNGATDATFGQVLQSVEAAAPAISPEHLEAAEIMMALISDKNSFFAARYKGCYIKRNDILCQVFYKGKKSNKARKSYLKSKQILRLARQNKFQKVIDTNEREAIKAVGSMTKRERTNISKKILKASECTSPHLIAALAFKQEESLPKASTLSTVRALYAKTLECTTESEFSELGLYRGGLIEKWQNNTEKSSLFLTKLSEVSQDTALVSRAQFWTNHNERELGNQVAESTLANNFTNFPLSYHILTDYATMEDGPFQKVSELEDQEIKTRTENTILNSSIQLAEYFMEKKKDELARRALEFLDFSALKEAEPGFQLYVATLLSKFDDMNHQRFQVLGRLFQKHPEFKTVKNLNYYYPLAFSDLVVEHRRDQDPYLLLALIRQESSFNPNTKSPVGATGLMQIMPRTAKDFRKRTVTNKELLNPAFNVKLGARYFSALVKQFKNDHMKALASYNAGAGNVKKWMKRYPTENPLLFVDLIPFEETREYVAGILRNQYWYSKLHPELMNPPQIVSKVTNTEVK